MADRERKGLIARWLEGKERSEEYARSTLPTSRWGLFWDIFKGRFGRLVLTNLLILVTFIPLIALIFLRYVGIQASGMMGSFGAAMGGMYPAEPDVIGLAQLMIMQLDLLYFGLMIPAAAIAALGISGGMYIIRNLIWTEGVFVANDFVRGIKRNYWNVLEAVVLFTVVLFVARIMGDLADYLRAIGAQGAVWMTVSKVFGYILVAFVTLMTLWMISLGVNYKQGPWSLVRNSAVLTVGTFPQTVFFAAVGSWPVFLALFGGMNFFGVIGMFLMILFGFSYLFLVWMDFSQWAFDRFINPNIGVAPGRGLYNKETQTMGRGTPNTEDSAAMREYKRLIVAQGKSKLVCRPIKPIDDELEVYQLPDSFSREDLQRLRESKNAIEEDVKKYEEEHKDDEQFVEYNRRFEERERALEEETSGKKKKKKPEPPKMLNKRK